MNQNRERSQKQAGIGNVRYRTGICIRKPAGSQKSSCGLSVVRYAAGRSPGSLNCIDFSGIFLYNMLYHAFSAVKGRHQQRKTNGVE